MSGTVGADRLQKRLREGVCHSSLGSGVMSVAASWLLRREWVARHQLRVLLKAYQLAPANRCSPLFGANPDTRVFLCHESCTPTSWRANKRRRLRPHPNPTGMQRFPTSSPKTTRSTPFPLVAVTNSKDPCSTVLEFLVWSDIPLRLEPLTLTRL